MYLLDTCILLWAIEGNTEKLGKRLHSHILDENNAIFVSVVSLWEIVIKSSLGKLKIPDDLIQQIKNNNFTWLNVEVSHVLELGKLPPIHQDPFDRLLIAQARASNLKFMTIDQNIIKYDLSFLN
jgi:PIN domain nuclease of toxin-antitoxin system